MRTFNVPLQADAVAPWPIDDDAPALLRQEFVAIAFDMIDQAARDRQTHLRRVIARLLRITRTEQMHGGFRAAASRGVRQVGWPGFYDFVAGLWPEIPPEFRAHYLAEVNRLLTAHGVVWRLDADGQLRRRLSPTAQRQIDTAFRRLAQPRFATALASFRDAMSAYHDRPRRERDVCHDMLDAVAAVSKEALAMPSASFSHVLAKAARCDPLEGRRRTAVLRRLQAIVDGRSGATNGVALEPTEVDFVFRACVAGILLFASL